MCGICGICGNQNDEWISESNFLQTHRGPDDEGIFRDRQAGVSLAMCRLAILDIEGGRQPMSTQDGRFTIVFNGEIYNAPDLRAELAKKGVKFFTDHSDTEVLLHLYSLEGEKMLDKLNGMFAFAIYDKDKKILFCARDHMGIKPFYYFQSEGRFAFASELKSLLSLPFIKREINFQSLFHYMSLMYVPGDETIIKNIRRLPAGHSLILNLPNSNFQIKRWFKPIFSENKNLKTHQWAQIIREELEKAVLRWTLSDVSIGCSLSGGLDSSAIVGLLAKQGCKLKTYSLGFIGKNESYWNELPRARRVAQKWGTDHHELVMNVDDLMSDLLAMVWHLDEPYGGGLPSWTVFKFMSRDVKVGLTGSGGDEMFGNYGKWRFLEKSFLHSFLFGKTDKNISTENFNDLFFKRFYYFSDEDKRENVFNNSKNLSDTGDFLYKFFVQTGAKNLRNKIAYVDFCTQLPEEFLMMTDRFSMAHSLEARTPFLDRKFVELMLSVPAEIRTKRMNIKYLLKQAVSDVLPWQVLHGRKKGFVIPIKLWISGGLRPLIENLLAPSRLKKQGIFKQQFYSEFIKPHLEGKADNTNKIWAALMFQLWHHLFIEEETLDKPSYNWKNIIS